jgi:Fe-S cluster biogenesis protein NfuA
MDDKSVQNNRHMQRAFAEKVKNMVGIIGKSLQNSGGSLKLVSVDKNNTVKVRFQGIGKDNPEAEKVLKKGVKVLLKHRIPEIKEVVTVE